MAFRMREEPDCSGRCACSQTASQSAIAAITGRRKSFGCGLVKRIRSTPSTASQARSSSPNSVRISGSRSRPHELTFWPSSVTSRTPSRASRVTSAMTSPGRRLCSRPRTAGTMQYAHFELHPIEIEAAAGNAEPTRAEPLAEVGDRPRAERDVDVRVQLEEPLALRLRVTAADRDHLAGVALLQGGGLGQVRREPRVGLLADRAGVEDEDVGLFLRRALPQAELLEHALNPLAVMSVHLAAEGGDVVPPHGPECYPWSFPIPALCGSSASPRSPSCSSRDRPSSTSSSRAPSRAVARASPPSPGSTSGRSCTSSPRPSASRR